MIVIGKVFLTLCVISAVVIGITDGVFAAAETLVSTFLIMWGLEARKNV